MHLKLPFVATEIKFLSVLLQTVTPPFCALLWNGGMYHVHLDWA